MVLSPLLRGPSLIDSGVNDDDHYPDSGYSKRRIRQCARRGCSYLFMRGFHSQGSVV